MGGLIKAQHPAVCYSSRSAAFLRKAVLSGCTRLINAPQQLWEHVTRSASFQILHAHPWSVLLCANIIYPLSNKRRLHVVCHKTDLWSLCLHSAGCKHSQVKSRRLLRRTPLPYSNTVIYHMKSSHNAWGTINQKVLCYMTILKLFEGDSCSLGHIKSTLLVQVVDSVLYEIPEASLFN